MKSYKNISRLKTKLHIENVTTAHRYFIYLNLYFYLYKLQIVNKNQD